MEREFGLVSTTHRVARWLGAVLSLAAALSLSAQSTFGPVVVLRTGCDAPLVSATQAAGSLNASGPTLFQFAFSTEPTTWALLVTAVVFFFAFQWRSE